MLSSLQSGTVSSGKQTRRRHMIVPNRGLDGQEPVGKRKTSFSFIHWKISLTNLDEQSNWNFVSTRLSEQKQKRREE